MEHMEYSPLASFGSQMQKHCFAFVPTWLNVILNMNMNYVIMNYPIHIEPASENVA